MTGVLRWHLYASAVTLALATVGAATASSAPSPGPVAAAGALVLITLLTMPRVTSKLPPHLHTAPLYADLLAIALIGSHDRFFTPWLAAVIPLVGIARAGGRRSVLAASTMGLVAMTAGAAWAISELSAEASQPASVGLATCLLAAFALVSPTRFASPVTNESEALRTEQAAEPARPAGLADPADLPVSAEPAESAVPPEASEVATPPDQLRDQTMASFVHDLRSPMSSVLGFIDLVLEDRSLAPDHREALEIALKNGHRLMTHVTDFVEACRPGATTDLTLALDDKCDLAEVLRETVEAMRPLAGAREVTVSLDAPEHLVVDGDPEGLRRVLENLLSNAVSYNDQGGWIDIVLSSTRKQSITLAVSNTGQAVPSDEHAKLFDRFYRSESAQASTVSGTGIGLSVVKEIVELHSGTVAVSSSRESGITTFTVTMPIRQPSRDQAS